MHSPHPVDSQLVGHLVINNCAKFEISNFTHHKNTKGNTKSINMIWSSHEGHQQYDHLIQH